MVLDERIKRALSERSLTRRRFAQGLGLAALGTAVGAPLVGVAAAEADGGSAVAAVDTSNPAHAGAGGAAKTGAHSAALRAPAVRAVATSPNARAQAEASNVLATLTPEFTIEETPSIREPVIISSVVGGELNPNLPWVYQGADMTINSSHDYAMVLSPTYNGKRGENTQFPFQVAFDFDGEAFEIKLTSGSEFTWRLRVWADGQVSAYQVSEEKAKLRYLKVRFASRAQRRIILEIDEGVFFGGLLRVPTDSIQAPNIAAPGKFAVVGDSYSVGGGINGTGASAQSYFWVLARLLGFVEVRMYGQSGTGLVNPNGKVGNYRRRIGDVLGYRPDVLLIQGSQNDYGEFAKGGKIEAQIAAYAAELRAGLPDAMIIASTPMPVRDALRESCKAAAEEAARAWPAAGVPLIHAFAEEWVRGTGWVGNATGAGNSDYYCSTVNNEHPSLAGHDYLARRLSAKMAPLLGISL